MKVKLKTAKEMNQMWADRKITMHVNDSGEWVTLCTLGNPSHCLTFWHEDFGKEYLIVDHERPISRLNYEIKKDLFEELL